MEKDSRKIALSVNKLKTSSNQKYDSKFIEKWYSPTEHRSSKDVIPNRKSFKIENLNLIETPKILPFECKSNKDFEYFDISFRKIKNCLKNSCPISKFKVLQAIRWRITRSNQEVQVKTLKDIQKYNLFNLGHSKSLLEELIWPVDVTIALLLQNCTARLLNSIVSTETGRNYIGDHSIINLLVWGENLFLQSFKFTDREFVENHTSDMLIGTIMKLCLDAWQKRDVIRKGLLKWLLNHLENVEFTASPYHLNYATSLLLLILSDQNSKELVLLKSRQLLALLARYLEKVENKAFQNIQNCLLAVFRCTKMIRIAKNIKFDEVLKGILEMRKDLVDGKHKIQKILGLFTNEFCLKSFDEFIEIPEFKQSDDFNLYLDDEIEEEDNIIINDDDDGENLLKCKYYLSEKDKKYEDEKLKSKSLKCESILKKGKRESLASSGNTCRSSLKTKSCHELSDGENVTRNQRETERRLAYQSSIVEQMKLIPSKSLKSQSDIHLTSARSENSIQELISIQKNVSDEISMTKSSIHREEKEEISPGGSKVMKIKDSKNMSNKEVHCEEATEQGVLGQASIYGEDPGSSKVMEIINFDDVSNKTKCSSIEIQHKGAPLMIYEEENVPGGSKVLLSKLNKVENVSDKHNGAPLLFHEEENVPASGSKVLLSKLNKVETVSDKIKYSLNENHHNEFQSNEFQSINEGMGDKIFSNTEFKIYKEHNDTNETILVQMNKSSKNAGKSIIIIL